MSSNVQCPPYNPVLTTAGSFGIQCVTQESCPSTIIPTNQSGSGDANPPVWCMSVPTVGALQALNLDGSIVNPNPYGDDYYFGLTALTLAGNAGSGTTYLPPPTNPCPDDQYCTTSGMAQPNSCCNTAVGALVLENSAPNVNNIATALTIYNTCTPDNQLTTGCLPCDTSIGYYPVPQAIVTGLTGPSSNGYTATLYSCLPVFIDVNIVNGATTNYSNSTNTQLDYSIWVGSTDSSGNFSYSTTPVAACYVTPSGSTCPTATARLAPNEAISFGGWAMCNCGGSDHCQYVSTYYFTYEMAYSVLVKQANNGGSGIQPINVPVTIDFSGSTSCGGFLDTSCRNGNIGITVTPAGIAQPLTTSVTPSIPFPVKSGKGKCE